MFDEPLRAAVYAGALSVILELSAVLTSHHVIRKALHTGVLLITSYASAMLLVLYPNIPGFLVWFTAMYRVLNATRVLYGRTHQRRSLHVTRRTSWFLLIFQFLAVGILVLSEQLSIRDFEWLYVFCASAIPIAFVMLFSMRRNLAKALVREEDSQAAASHVPTVSVCIPARNETDDLARCLESVLASNYPKLEILVLDDCSHERTSEIIKGFAQDGVRFLRGDEIRRGWLAKNQACQTLADAATGELLLFCGVDVGFDKQTIRALVSSLESRHKDMISVLPKGINTEPASGLVQPMRYWWELALPRRLFNRPAALSTAWIIRRKALADVGSFAAVSNMVVPESYFARELARGDKYSFMRTNSKLTLTSAKTLKEQWATAVRLRYPQLRKRPEAVLPLVVAEIVFLLVPTAVFIAGFIFPLGNLWLLSGIPSLLFLTVHYRIIRAWQVPAPVTAAALFPLALLTEIWVLQYSMFKYEFSTVSWKERNICIPVMHTIARLPKA